MRAFLLMLAIALSGCTTCNPAPIPNPLPLPERPDLPVLSEGELACLTDDAYARLMRRDMQRRQYAEDLEAIIRSTHGRRP